MIMPIVDRLTAGGIGLWNRGVVYGPRPVHDDTFDDDDDDDDDDENDGDGDDDRDDELDWFQNSHNKTWLNATSSVSILKH